MSATYRTLKVGLWHDSWVDGLDPEAKLYWVWLLTNEHTQPSGIWEMKPGTGAFELGLDYSLCKGYREAFQSDGKAFFRGSWVLITGYVRHQPNSPPKVWQKITKSVLSAPDGVAKAWFEANRDIVEALDGDSYADQKSTLTKAMDSLCKGYAKAMDRDTRVETETETETEGERARDKSRGASPNDPPPPSPPENQRERISEDPDGLSYMPKAEDEQGVVEDALECYRNTWSKPGYTLRHSTRSQIMERHREFRDRDLPEAHGGRPVEYVIVKAHRLYENGDEFYGQNCALKSLTKPDMFENVFEAQEATGKCGGGGDGMTYKERLFQESIENYNDD